MSVEIIGKQIEVGVSVEATRGVVPATVSKWVRNSSVNLLEKAESVTDEATRGVFEDSEGRRITKTFIEGDIEMPLFLESVGYLFYNLYGGVTSTVVSGAIYSHVFALAQSSLAPSLSFFVKDGGVQELAMSNSHINTLEITANPEEYVTIKTGILATKATDSVLVPSYTTERDFIGKEVVVKLADTEAGLAGAIGICVKDLSVSFDKGLISDYCLGSVIPTNIYTSKMSIEGSFTKNFDSEIYKDLYLGAGTKYMSIAITGDTVISGTTYPSITLVFNKVQINDWKRGGGKDDLVTEEISFKAYYNSADAKASKITVVNSTTVYKLS